MHYEIMQMTEVYASTAAVTIPVLALASAVEMRTIGRRIGDLPPPKRISTLAVVATIVIVAWCAAMAFGLIAELKCLDFLAASDAMRGKQSADWWYSTSFINGVIAALFLPLLFIPVNVFLLYTAGKILHYLADKLSPLSDESGANQGSGQD
ncbi:hypothetical protein ACFYUY_38405 [Kitasatospora sp. NPDC004745]|uniref:hypothetical protein n=1 Tax=Kitasatospora sp. NPDC004745 TaxID=3364019 RepID=UPI0036A7BAB7